MPYEIVFTKAVRNQIRRLPGHPPKWRTQILMTDSFHGRNAEEKLTPKTDERSRMKHLKSEESS